ncbi:hypothetical protein MKC91_02110 [[Clostridium] innocuum]|nr:hypothetical protein [Erysipelotrichaceae bacterium]MCR0383184.1 hypothetical protein [[Clostridium] innocuum]MCR0411577.1 hypothetical protein [[Clostridium] innocuum]MCR0533572.1 hypothetical protein [[Clostridium] innocuum]MCR0537183.1 hypothetical protein [[Clostridium] innocuum]
MKKSTLLSLLTAGAVIATSAGTFAAWDQLETTTNEVTLKYAAGVNVSTTVQPTAITDSLGGENGVESVTSDFTINVKNAPAGSKMNLETVNSDDSAVTLPTGVTVEYFKKDGDTVTAFDPDDVINDATSESGKDMTYQVKVTVNPTTASASEASAFSKFKVKATLTPPAE